MNGFCFYTQDEMLAKLKKEHCEAIRIERIDRITKKEARQAEKEAAKLAKRRKVG
ncbi:MAG: hypothetical protein Q8L24_01755 [bacterium]|nr:hypothetical protein [bacterium]